MGAAPIRWIDPPHDDVDLGRQVRVDQLREALGVVAPALDVQALLADRE